MSRKLCVFLLLGLLIVGQLWARPFDRHKDSANYKTLAVQGPARIIPPGEVVHAERNFNRPIRDDVDEVAYGEDIIIGYTWYDYQHNGSIGKMVVRDNDLGTHFAWMSGYNGQQDPRHVIYNFIDEDGVILNDPEDGDRSVIDNGTRSGYCMLTTLPDGRASVFYHVLGHVEDPNVIGVGVSVDWGRGIGAPLSTYPSPMPNVGDLIWPKGDWDRQGFGHVTATEYTDAGQSWQRVGYWRGEANEDFDEVDWGQRPTIIDTVSVISAVVAVSSQSDKVALGWHKNRVGSDIGAWENALGGYQRNNDIVYIVSEDGEDWEFRDGIQSMTKIIPPNPDLIDISMDEAYGDTFRPYCDLDLQFDPWEGEDNLYAVFAAGGFKEEPYDDPDEDGDPEPVDIVYAVHGHLWFWNSVEDTITMIADGWYNGFFSNPAAERNFRPGVWRLNADRGSIAFNPDDPGTIYVVWVSFPHLFDNIDGENVPVEGAQVQDTSAAGYANAEIMVSISNDRGITWRQPINVTETIWDEDGDIGDAPDAGECQSDNWASVAKVADGALHIMYVRDTDAGGIPQNEGVATNSPVIYHRIDLEDLPENDFVEIPEWEGRGRLMFHNYHDPAPAIRDIEREFATPVPDESVTISADVSAPVDMEIEMVTLEYKVGGEEGELMSVEMEVDEDGIYLGDIPAMDEGSWVWYRIVANDDGGGETTKPEGWWYSYVVRNEGELQIRDIQFRPADWVVDYSPYMDYEVTFDGVITTNAEFASLYGGYGVQDAAEEWSGVIVRGIEEDLNVGDNVTITGTVMEQDPNDNQKWRYMTFIDVAGYDVTGMQDPIAPIQVEVSDLSFSTLAENLEGCLVELGMIEVRPLGNAPENYIPITDGNPDMPSDSWITLYGLDEDLIIDIQLDQVVQGTTIDGLVGIFVENERYAVAPRKDRDIGILEVKDDNAPTPSAFTLDPAYPNPFNPSTTVGFAIAISGRVNLSIYNLEGRLVQTIVNGSVQAGHHTFTVDASDFATGMYLLRMEAGEFTASQKLLLIK